MTLWNDISPNFSSTNDFINRFSVTSFHDQKKVEEYLAFFKLDEICKALEADRIESHNHRLELSVSASEETPFKPEYDDLVRLHYIALTRETPRIMMEF